MAADLAVTTLAVISADLDIIEKMSTRRSEDFIVFPFCLTAHGPGDQEIYSKNGSSKD